ncbi:MAG: tRNA (adenosine(37)-N6)-dimethylallyltransferase MiaA [Acidobacteriota bacterium]
MTAIVIAGPTGTGKTELAVRLAETVGAEIVNFDSIQIYRGFDIGSAKPTLEVRARVPHHLYDIVDADTEFNAADYAALARTTCATIEARGRRPLLVGGTFFYLRALLSGLPEMPPRSNTVRFRLQRLLQKPRGPGRLHRWLSKIDPQSGRKIAPGDRHRIERALEVWICSGKPISSWQRPVAGADVMRSTKIALSLERNRLSTALDLRVDTMYAEGLIEETGGLLARFPRATRPFSSIGYKEAAAVITGEMNLNDAISETKRRTRAYAKRQMTWLRAEPRMHWLDASDPATFANAVQLLTE